MKRIYLQDLGEDFTTKNLLRQALRDVAQAGGADFEEQVKRGRVLEILGKLEKETAYFDLEDADFELSLRIFKGYKWALADPRIPEAIKKFGASAAPPVITLVEGGKKD